MTNEAHIVVEGVSMVYEAGEQRLHALSNIDVSIERGEFISIIGPSGCGKSTLLRIIGGLQSPSEGRVLIEGAAPREAQRRKQLGFVFQDPSLLPWRTVIENVRLPQQVNRGRKPGRKGAPDSADALDGDREERSAAERFVELVGLDDFRRYYPHQLSGGMQQRVALARSFVTSPSVLLMDEPFGALDEITRSAMRYELMRVWRAQGQFQVQQERGCSVVFVTHSIPEAVLLSDRVIVCSPQPGRITAVLEIDLPRPRPEEIEEDPAFIDYTRRLRALLREHAPVMSTS